MISARSFAEFIKAKCFDGLCKAVENYANENWCLLGLYSHRLQNIEKAVFSDATIKRIYVNDSPVRVSHLKWKWRYQKPIATTTTPTNATRGLEFPVKVICHVDLMTGK